MTHMKIVGILAEAVGYLNGVADELDSRKNIPHNYAREQALALAGVSIWLREKVNEQELKELKDVERRLR